MVETILVTGATGTVGNEVVKQLSGVIADINIKAALHSQNKVEKFNQIDDKRPIWIMLSQKLLLTLLTI